MGAIVVWLLLLNSLVAVAKVAVDGDSNCKEAIQSIEATLVVTLETKFQQLKLDRNKGKVLSMKYNW